MIEADTNATPPMYRVDKFAVPAGARDEFLERATQALQLLKAERGFVQGFFLEQRSTPETYDFMTFVEWASHEDVERVTATVEKHYKDLGYDPQARLETLGIKAERGRYRRVQF